MMTLYELAGCARCEEPPQATAALFVAATTRVLMVRRR
jgi:hypothetical protein